MSPSIVVTATLVLGLALAACGKGGSASKITEARLKEAKAMVKAPQPLADVRPKLVGLLGEPTATEGENLVWAGISGSECHHLVLVVSGDTVNGTTGGMAHELVTDQYAECARRAGRK